MCKAAVTNPCRWILAALVLLSGPVMAAPKKKPTPPLQAEYVKLLTSDPSAAGRRVLAAAGPKAGAEIDALGAVLAGSPDKAAPVLDALAKEDSPAAATTAAELLLKISVGAPANGKPSRRSGLSDELAARAATMLDHDDPFVRGLAEWALATRVGLDNDRRDFWPKPNPPAWFQRYVSLTPAQRLECDYVRQAVAGGAHREVQALLTHGRAVAQRAQAIAAPTPAMKQALPDLESARDLLAQRKAYLALRLAARAVVLSSPDLDFDRLALVTRYSCIGTHNLASYSYHPSHYRPGGDILVRNGLAPDARIRPALDGRLGPGHVRGIDLWWDADRVCFGFTPQPGWNNGAVSDGGEYPEPTHIYEIALDGTNLRQLTNDRKWIDLEPCYAPDGSVVFGSDRAGIGSECGGWQQNAGTLNLFRVSADGRQVSRLTYNKDYDRYPHCLDDGQIAFLRWDYAERQFFSCHSLWTVRPDGRGADALYKAHVQSGPLSLRDARPVPGSPKLVAIACGHHNLAEGAVTLVDPTVGVNEPGGMRYVTPHVASQEGGLGKVEMVNEGGVTVRGGLYQHPWALSERSFLVSYAWSQPHSSTHAIYYIDVHGNMELIHRDAVLESAHPMPLRKRPRPPVLPSPDAPAHPNAVCYLSDVYRNMPDVEPGSIKYLRISERINWVFDKTPAGELRWLPSNPFSPQFGYWTWAPIRVIGTVPVEEDGSAYFQVPPGLAVYFQALDENFMEVRRMRSHIAFQSGESRGCVGCHESRAHADNPRQQPTLALRRSASMPTPPPWGDGEILDYEKLVQPILERRCVSCHGQKEPKGGLELTARRDAYGFAQSYRSMFGLKWDEATPVSDGDKWYSRHYPRMQHREDKAWYAAVLEGKAKGQLVTVSDRTSAPWQKPIDASISQPKEFGSHRSKLILTLLKDDLHRKECKLPADEWQTLVTWVDANAPYHSAFYQKHDEKGQVLAQPLRVRLTLPPAWPQPRAAVK